MKFTNHDTQKVDWIYHITHKMGQKVEVKRGQRKKDTKKWNGVGKKESQIKDRQVLFIDLDRITPARNYHDKLFSLAKASSLKKISDTKVEEIEAYISYLLEDDVRLNKLAEHQGRDVFKYSNSGEYSSFNAATGEEVLTRIIIDIVEASKNSLILIDEIEVGLHPKIQRRLIDVLYHLSRYEQKQFILTSHSPTILSSLPERSRVFIEKKHDGTYRAISPISVNAALSKMDSVAHPLVDLYCEDAEGKKIVEKALSAIQQEKKLVNFNSLINIIASGPATAAYENFKVHQRTYPNKRIKTGYACVLDGDMKLKTKDGKAMFPQEENLHFLYSDLPPEKFLTKAYLQNHPNRTVEYHYNHSNVHCLFDKLVENTHLSNRHEAFEACWAEFVSSNDGMVYFSELQLFILSIAAKYSPDL